jgi:hypothetical protein
VNRSPEDVDVFVRVALAVVELTFVEGQNAELECFVQCVPSNLCPFS